MPTEKSRRVFPTEKALADGVRVDMEPKGYTYWWLLPYVDSFADMNGNFSIYPKAVFQFSGIQYHSRNVYHSDFTICPSILVGKYIKQGENENMSGRFFLSEQEIEKRYGNSIAVISDTWTRSVIYYDTENDQFVEERYHEEYLDTGTVCDGCYVIPDGYLWKELVRTCNEEGMAAYLNYRNHIPKSYDTGKKITMEEFLKGLNALMENNPKCQYFCKEIDSVFLITNESKTILGKIGKADNYYFFFNPRSDVQKQGFQTLEEALAKVLDAITFYHNNRPECDCKVNEVKGYHIGKAYEESFSKQDKKSNLRSKKSLLAKLFRK